MCIKSKTIEAKIKLIAYRILRPAAVFLKFKDNIPKDQGHHRGPHRPNHHQNQVHNRSCCFHSAVSPLLKLFSSFLYFFRGVHCTCIFFPTKLNFLEIRKSTTLPSFFFKIRGEEGLRASSKTPRNRM